jgi:hypothetical protein
MPDRVRLDASLFPVQVFFNAVCDQSFVGVVERLSHGIGHCVNDIDCSFPEDLDPDEEPFEGIRFSTFEEEVLLDNQSLLDIVAVACDEHLLRHPTDKGRLEAALADFSKS